jgi:oxaloacetate decarboxylase alpha subunit
MITNLKFMLSQRGMEHRLEEVLEEISVIREEWGYPVMITPFSQIVGTQAVLNILLGERYKSSTEEGIRYLLGHYGNPPGPVNQNVIDIVTSLPEAEGFLNWKQPQPSINDLRKEIDRPGISDDELLLRILFPEEHVEATLAAGPINIAYPKRDKPVMALIDELAKRKEYRYISVKKGDFSLTLKRNS